MERFNKLFDAKALVVLVAIIGVIVMNILGRIEGKEALDFIKWLVVTLVGALALEKAAGKTAAATIIAAPEVDNEKGLADLKKAG